MNEEPMEITLIVISVLEKLQIRYLIGGSLASAIYGEPRATRDADLLADIRSEHIKPLCELLEPQFNISIEAILNGSKSEAAERWSMCSLALLFLGVNYFPQRLMPKKFQKGVSVAGAVG
jgi:hypothetical protein